MASSQNPVRVVLFTGGRGSSVLSRELIRSERIALTLKYSDYRAQSLHTDTTKLWLSVDYAF